MGAVDKTNSGKLQCLQSDWKTANEFYFKSIISMQVLQQSRLKFHKDFTLEQVFLNPDVT